MKYLFYFKTVDQRCWHCLPIRRPRQSRLTIRARRAWGNVESDSRWSECLSQLPISDPFNIYSHCFWGDRFRPEELGYGSLFPSWIRPFYVGRFHRNACCDEG